MAEQKNTDENLLAALAYLLIPAIIFLIMDKRSFIRFHSLQAIVLFVCYIIVTIILSLIGIIPFVGFIIGIVKIVINVLFLIAAIYTAIKAYHGERFKLFFIGDLVSKWT